LCGSVAACTMLFPCVLMLFQFCLFFLSVWPFRAYPPPFPPFDPTLVGQWERGFLFCLPGFSPFGKHPGVMKVPWVDFGSIKVPSYRPGATGGGDSDLPVSSFSSVGSVLSGPQVARYLPSVLPRFFLFSPPPPPTLMDTTAAALSVSWAFPH